ncbi:pinin-like [Oscarella lobularis]|uniref:pinin-like n=1 Tax=Oscarella lobularis TaxID=121494 RepID=UPI003313569B
MAVAHLEKIQQTLVKAREELFHVDENIKKVTGRDPSEFRRFPSSRFARGGRRRSFRDGNEPPPKRIAETEGSTDQPVSVVKIPEGATESKTDEIDENKPALQSSVVRPDRAARRESLEEREEDKKRNRRMFGQLMGTLMKFKDQTQHDAARMRHRLQLEAKIEEENQKEREVAAQERRLLYNERKTKQMELRKLEHQVHLVELSQEWEEHSRLLSSGNFIRLKTSPALFYKPGTHTEATLKLVEETKQQILAETADRKKEVEIMIADREAMTIKDEGNEENEGDNDGKGENGKGGSGKGGGDVDAAAAAAKGRERGPEEDVLMRNVGEETEGMLGGDEEGEGNQGDVIMDEGSTATTTAVTEKSTAADAATIPTKDDEEEKE